jgi:hypothetical protein
MLQPYNSPPCKMRSAFSNAYHASAEGFSGSTVMAKDTQTLLVMECPTYGTWFASFACGCHKRMGNIVKPDRAVFLEVIHHNRAAVCPLVLYQGAASQRGLLSRNQAFVSIFIIAS